MSQASLVTRIAQAFSARRVTSESMESALRQARSHGLPAAVLPGLEREWITDCLLVDGIAPELPRYSGMPPFLSWLSERLASPYHVSLSRLTTARGRFGVDLALDGCLRVLPSEVAWAQLCRLRGDDAEACLAHAWLRSARADPGRALLSCLEALCSTDDTGYISSPWRLSTPSDIERLDGRPDGFMPLCMMLADREFSERVASQGVEVTAVMAARIRVEALREARAASWAQEAARLASVHPERRLSVLSGAADLGLVSDEILDAVSCALDAMRQSGPLPMPAHRDIATRLPAFIGTAPMLDEIALEARRAIVSNLGASWLRCIPAEWKAIADGKGGVVRTAVLWTRDVTEGMRRPPSDPLLDYGLWLAERL